MTNSTEFSLGVPHFYSAPPPAALLLRRLQIEQLKGIRCLSTIAGRKTNKDIDVLSCPDAIAIALQEALGQEYRPGEKLHQKKCLNCGHPLRKEAGCYLCDNCRINDCG